MKLSKAEVAESHLSNPVAYRRLEKMVEERKKKGLGEPGPTGKRDFVAIAEVIPPVMDRLRQMMQKHNITPERLAQAEQEQRGVDTAEEFRRQRQQARADAWNRFCPPKFNGTFDPSKCQADSVAVWAVVNWEFNPKGMFIFGASGRSKTWAVYALLRKLWKEQLGIKLLDGIQFGTEASRAFSEPSETERWLRGLIAPDVLVIDDLAKRFTPAAQQAFFAVMDRRSIKLRPTIITANVTGDELTAQIDDKNLSEPMLRRMREHCQIVLF